MVWPFLIMLTGSMAGRFDYHRYSPVLRSLWNPEDRFMRVLASFHGTFPHETFPDAPVEWGSWTALARDTEGVKAFVQPWLQGMRDPATAKAWRIMAQDYAAFNRTYDVRN